MKTYVITCGECDEEHIAYVTADFAKAVEFILNSAKDEWEYNMFERMECWEDETYLYTYRSWRDVFDDIYDLTTEKIENDIIHCIVNNWADD